MREEALSTVEREFAIKCIASGFRVDGRAPGDPRRVGITLGPAWGYAEVSFDRTRAVASAVVDAVTPSPDRPNEGTVNISVELSPTSSEYVAREIAVNRGNSATSPASMELRGIIERTVRESRAIDTEALCILAGVKVWSVRIHVDVIDDDGNAIDVAMLAVMASLLHARHADVTVSGRDVKVHAVDEREPVPLPVHHVPLSTSFALFSGTQESESDFVAMDPVRREELASDGAISFAFNAQGEVCGLHKAGGMPLHQTLFVQCGNAAAQRTVQLTEILKRAMADAAIHHPLASVRPVLVTPEPRALLKAPKSGSLAGEKNVTDVAGSTWNATLVNDSAPPQLSPSNAVGSTPNTVCEIGEDVMEDVQGEVRSEAKLAEAANASANKRAERPLRSSPNTSVPSQRERDVHKKLTVTAAELLDMEDGSSSSGSDLMGAVLSLPKGGSGRAKATKR